MKGYVLEIDILITQSCQEFIILVERESVKCHYRVLKHTATNSELTLHSGNSPQKPTAFFYSCLHIQSMHLICLLVIYKVIQQFIFEG